MNCELIIEETQIWLISCGHLQVRDDWKCFGLWVHPGTDRLHPVTELICEGRWNICDVIAALKCHIGWGRIWLSFLHYELWSQLNTCFGAIWDMSYHRWNVSHIYRESPVILQPEFGAKIPGLNETQSKFDPGMISTSGKRINCDNLNSLPYSCLSSLPYSCLSSLPYFPGDSCILDARI